ncbi:MAG: biotin/lipoyl-containing protein, partial [Wenzhouxiangellaceae bacterium]|nr:biotin/lipoyl-containing protein [Wenzhouxiangellaceae bacterium]
MSTEIKVPNLPESVSDATVAKWHKKAGDSVERDENLVDLETDKVVLEVPAPADGVLESIDVEEGETVGEGDLLGKIAEGEGEAAGEAGKEEGGDETDEEAGQEKEAEE